MTTRCFSFLFILDNLELGGIQRQLLEVCRALIHEGHRCTVACFRSKPGFMVPKLRETGVEVTFLEKKKGIDIFFLFRLRKLIKKEGFDLIHALTPQASFWAACSLPYKSKTRFVGSLLNTYKFDNPFDRFCEALIAAPRMDAVFINSGAGERYYRKSIANPPPLWRIYNGVRIATSGNRDTIREKLGIGGDVTAILCIGRLEMVKRHMDAIAAVSLIRNHNKNVSLYIIGEGSLRKSLESYATSLKIQEYVKFLGERDDTQEILPGFDLFIMPSQSEGFPNALLEAMAAGLPCIATRVGGIPEIIRNTKNGILVNPCSPGELAEAIQKLTDSPDMMKTIGEAARRDVIDRFDINRMIKTMISHYKSLLCQRRYPMAYVLSQFPKISEAFILREMVEMRKRGISFCIVSLKSSSEKTMHKETRVLQEDILYLPWIGIHLILSNFIFFFGAPKVYCGAFFEFLMLHRRYPTEMIKAFSAWFKTVGFSWILKRNGIAHIHANWASIPTSCAMAMAKLVSCTFSFTAHAYDIYYLPTSLEEKIEKALFVTTCTEKNRSHLSDLTRREHEDKIHLIRHFMSPPQKTPHGEENPPVVLSIGSLDRYKGHDLLIGSCVILWRKGLDFDLHIIGDGPEKTRLKYLIRRYRIEKRVRLMGGMPQDKVFKELGKATIFTLASVKGKRSDNLPNAIIEASLLNVPSIMADIGSVREFIIPGETGLLFKAGCVKDLSHKLETLLSDAELRKRLALKARNKALGMFGIEQNAPLLEELFRSAIIKNLPKEEIDE